MSNSASKCIELHLIHLQATLPNGHCCGYHCLRYYTVITSFITYNYPMFTSLNSSPLSSVLHLSKSDLTKCSLLFLPFKSPFLSFMFKFIQQKCSCSIVLFTYRIATMFLIQFWGNRGFVNMNLNCVQRLQSLKYIS